MKKIYIMPQSLVVEIEDVIIATSNPTPKVTDTPSDPNEWNLSKERGALDEMLDEQDF